MVVTVRERYIVSEAERVMLCRAGVLLVREAGGEVFDSTGDEHSVGSKETLAANGGELKNKVVELENSGK